MQLRPCCQHQSAHLQVCHESLLVLSSMALTVTYKAVRYQYGCCVWLLGVTTEQSDFEQASFTRVMYSLKDTPYMSGVCRCEAQSFVGEQQSKLITAVWSGTRQLVLTCCAFGNSVTLPLVFLLALLPGAAADRATGYLALFMMGWSPMLWTFGLYLLNRGMPNNQPGILLVHCFTVCVFVLAHSC